MPIDFPQARACPYDPPPAYRALNGSPLHRVTLPDGTGSWLVTGHAETRRLLADPRLSADRRRDGFPVVLRRTAAPAERPAFVFLDPPEHGHYRRMLTPEFTLRRFKDLRPLIERTVHDRLDAMLAAGPPADLVRDFALPVTSIVICHLLGVPYDDHEFFQDHSRRMLQAGSPEEAMSATGALYKYMGELVADPPDGLLARLKDQLPGPELVENALILLVAGHETTASTIALGVIALLDHPAELAKLHKDPAGAVEEILRYTSVVDTSPARIAVEDIEIADVTIKAGEGVLFSTSMANRDPGVFDQPDRFDVARQARPQVAFGYGVHQCLGQNLARMELELALSALFRRIPALRLDGAVEDLPVHPATSIQGVNALPVNW
ncbi:cytochrome P450 [Actinocrispum sp. NPDC049592]|uniref:cytochrome P450 n=1 Tax=Actinocrispum sp. NPDC049592 TaxID=3154835 RepID=UPI00341DFDEC